MSVIKVRKKPVEVEAVLFDGENYAELSEFTDNKFFDVIEEDRDDAPEIIAEVYDKLHSTWVGVKKGQYIIKGLKGEYYPHDSEIFWDAYEEVHNG